MRRLLVSLAVLALTACATVPPAPKDVSQTAVYAEAAAASSEAIAVRLLSQRVITPQQAQEVLMAARAVDLAVKNAQALVGGSDVAGAQAQMAAVQSDLQVLTAFLQTHQ